MPANLFGRYVWLVDTLRRYKHLSYKEISERWQQSGLSYGEGDELPLRTFHNHRKAILDIFNIIIEIDPDVKGYKYHILNPHELEGDALRSWLIDSYATLNQIQADSKLQNRIEFENIPSGHTWLTIFMQAMRENKVMLITYQGFGKDYANTFEIEPYCLKLFQRRWYILAHSLYDDRIRIYALDRMENVEATEYTFVLPPDFDAQEYFSDYFGIIADSNVKKERVVLRAYKEHAHYLRTLPMHHSQKELESTETYTDFELQLRPTTDFVMELLRVGALVEVIEPESLRKTMRGWITSMARLYT